MMKLAKDRDIIKSNIGLADNFNEFKFQQFETSVIILILL